MPGTRACVEVLSHGCPVCFCNIVVLTPNTFVLVKLCLFFIVSGRNIVMEWSKCKVAKLVELFEQETVLWCITDPNHKNSNNRNDALERIAGCMECSVGEVEKKLHNLRSQYLREKTKIEKSKKSGAGTSDVYVSKWQYFSALGFLSTSTERMAHTSSINLVSEQNNIYILTSENEHFINLIMYWPTHSLNTQLQHHNITMV